MTTKNKNRQPVVDSSNKTHCKSPMHSNVINWLQSSLWLLIYSLTILIISAIFLGILFHILPSRSYINLAIEANQPDISNSIIEECSFSTKEASFTNLEKISFSFFPGATTHTKLSVSEDNMSMVPVTTLWDAVVINEEEFCDSGLYELVIQPLSSIDQSTIPEIKMLSEDSTSPFQFNIDKTQNETIKDVSCELLRFKKEGFTMYRLVHEFDIVGTKQHNTIIEGTAVRICINSCSAQLYYKGEVLRQYNSYEQLDISFPCLRSIHLAITGANCTFSDVKNLQCQVSNIHNLDLFGDGKVNVTYTPDSKDYAILKQPITVQSQDGSFLSAEIIQANSRSFHLVVQDQKENNAEEDGEQYTYSISAYGFAEKIDLANISLLPNLFGWFRENVYLLPTVFVTVIVGSISLIKLKRDEKPEIKKESEA